MIINHLENLNGLCTKTGLIKSFRYFFSSNTNSYGIDSITPTTYIVSASCRSNEFLEFTQRFKELEDHSFNNEPVPAKHCIENMWLVKPAAENQGRGIEIFKNNFHELKKFIQSKPPRTEWIVQKYIERPLLYYDRKFDIRMWALITWKRELYIYRPGYIRTSSDKYNINTKLNFVHLTNNCLQQFGNKYGAFEDGNTISFDRFAKYLADQFPSLDLNFERDILSRMKDLMIDSYLATKDELNPRYRPNCFELLGYDFLIDEDFRVWLIEINSNPYIGIPNKYIENLLPKMINDMMEICIDPCFPPVNLMPSRKIPNQFELLYNEEDGLNLRRGYDISIYPINNIDLKPPYEVLYGAKLNNRNVYITTKVRRKRS